MTPAEFSESVVRFEGEVRSLLDAIEQFKATSGSACWSSHAGWRSTNLAGLCDQVRVVTANMESSAKELGAQKGSS